MIELRSLLELQLLGYFLSGQVTIDESSQSVFLSKHSQTNASLNVSIDTVMSEFWPLSASTLISLVSYSRQQRILHLDMHIFRLVQCYGVNEASGSW